MKRAAFLIASSLLLFACTTTQTAQEEPIPVIATTADPDSAEGRTRTALERIEALNPRLNAVIAVDPTALDQARGARPVGAARAGPLFGMPILIKDNIETAGPLPTTAGSLALARQCHRPRRAAGRAAARRRRGDRRQGESVANGRTSARPIRSRAGARSAARCAIRYALNRNPCGSSLGQRAAVAAGMVPAAIGTETDGSITCPAAINGIVGFKPTVGLVSRTHVVPISHSQDTPGPMTLQRARRRPDHERHRRHRPRRPGDRRGRRAARRLYRRAVARRAARRPHRRDALLRRLRHRRRRSRRR